MTVIRVTPPPIRNLTRRAMMQRFTQAERIAIRSFIADTTNVSGIREIVEDSYSDLQSSPNTQLDIPEVGAGLLGLEALGLIAVGRAAEIMVDGTAAEKYDG